jgi:hypothetical protein
MTSDNSILVVFPSNIFSGHEMMAVKILDNIPQRKIVFLSSNLRSILTKNSEIVYYNSKISLYKRLLLYSIKNINNKIFLISGSPFGYPLLKVIIKIFGFYLIEYVPMPELPNMKDKFHHNLMPYINKALINKRVLIDNWQINYSAVKNVLIIKNIV